MLAEEFERIDPGAQVPKICIVLDNVCCISPHYVDVGKPAKKTLVEKHCVVALANGMVVLVDYPYKSMFQKLKAYSR